MVYEIMGAEGEKERSQRRQIDHPLEHTAQLFDENIEKTMNESAFFREKDEHTASSHYDDPVLSKKNKKF